MDHVNELCASYAHAEVGRRDFIARALRAGLAVAAVGSLVEIYSPSAKAADAGDALSPSGPSSSFDYRKYAGSTVRLQVSKHPYIEALQANLSKFTELTGINVTFDMQPESLYFDKLKFGLAQKTSDFDVFMLGAYMTWQYGPAC